MSKIVTFDSSVEPYYLEYPVLWLDKQRCQPESHEVWVHDDIGPAQYWAAIEACTCMGLRVKRVHNLTMRDLKPVPRPNKE